MKYVHTHPYVLHESMVGIESSIDLEIASMGSFSPLVFFCGE
jgi:hypothetical protein